MHKYECKHIHIFKARNVFLEVRNRKLRLLFNEEVELLYDEIPFGLLNEKALTFESNSVQYVFIFYIGLRTGLFTDNKFVYAFGDEVSEFRQG